MENERTCELDQTDDGVELPPGFRFHPTDEELITHYLFPKVLNNVFCAVAIGEADLNKCEPWDLPGRAKMGGKEWYFFCLRDRKYPTGLRTNRATEAGYWKATGKDKEIYRGKTLIGMKKTLVFYRGRAPKGEKSGWIMHEYRLEGKNSGYNLPKPAKNEWVICRVFHKSSGQKKENIAGFELNCSSSSSSLLLPPLMDSSSSPKLSHVTCFSSPMEVMNSYPSETLSISHSSASTSLYPPQRSLSENPEFSQPPNSYFFKMLLDNQLPRLKQFSKAEFSPDAGLSADISSGISNHEICQDDPSTEPVDLDCLWNY